MAHGMGLERCHGDATDSGFLHFSISHNNIFILFIQLWLVSNLTIKPCAAWNTLR